MMNLKNVVEYIIKIRIVIIAILFFFTAVAGYKTIKNLQIDNSLTIWFLEDDPSYKAYIDFQEEYGSDEIYIAMFPVQNAISKETMQKLDALTKAIDALPYVKTSFSLTKAKYPRFLNNNIQFDNLYSNNKTEESLKRLFKQLPNITSQLVSEDYKNVFFYVQLNPTPTIESKRKTILYEIEETIQKYFDEYHLTGPPVLNEAYSKGIYKESLLFGILTVLIITLMLLFLLPSKQYLFIALLSVGIPVSLLFGIITTTGHALNMISMLIPTILMVYCVSDIVHIINIFHKEGFQQKSITKVELITLSIRKSFTPCFYTTLTTFVGYFALYLSPLPAFKDMGIFTCIGLVLSFLIVYLVSIIGFSYLKLNFKTVKPILSFKLFNQQLFIGWLNRITSRYKNRIIVGFSALLLFGLYSILKVDIDTRSLDLLAEGEAKNDLRIVEKQLKGSSRLQLNVSTTNGSSVITKDALIQLEKFQQKLEDYPLINAPVSVVNVKQFLEKRLPIPLLKNAPEKRIKRTLSQVDDKDNSFFKLFSKDLTTAGITLSLPEMTTSQLNQVINFVKNSFETSFKTQDFKLKINGFAVVFAQLNEFILTTQLKSFIVAFIVAFLCLVYFIKSVRTTLLVLIPNILPLAVLAIIMRLLDIPLDVSTAMITPIMLGIAMDDTIHLVYNYKQKNNKLLSSNERINNAMHYTGNALIATTIALVAGFLIIASSATPSVSGFGILCAVTVAIALITDMFYLPALLKKFDK
ncbi:MAG: MMPL family transporter [Flavobacteriaceae bacterium]|nr:MMPL family transporter [Flavobacteriaceae bacterium]